MRITFKELRFHFILVLAVSGAFPVYAAEATLPISVRLVSCGPTVAQACELDLRCCGFLERLEIAQSHETVSASYEKPKHAADSAEELFDLKDVTYQIDMSDKTLTYSLQ